MNAKRSLNTSWRRAAAIPGLKRDVAALSVLIVAAIISTIATLAFLSGEGLFVEKIALRAEFEEVPGLNPNATPHVATIAGVRVGDIVSYEATDRGTAIVTMSIDPNVATIYDNATALLRPKNPLNDMQISINPGGPPGQPLGDNGLIPVGQTKRPIQVNEALQHLDERSQAAIENLMSASDIALVSAPQQLPGGLRAVDNNLNTMRPVVEALETRRENIAKLVTALSQISTAIGGDKERAARLADSTQQTLKVLADNDQDLVATFAEFPGLSEQLRKALSATQDLTEQLDPTLDNLKEAADELPDALEEFGDTIDELDETVEDLDPFVKKAKHVLRDLRPFVEDVDVALDDAVAITTNLDRDTKTISTYLTVIQAFIYNTSSVFGAGDANGGNIRGHFVYSFPDGPQALPGGQPGYSPGPEAGVKPGRPNEFTPIPDYVPGAPEHNAKTSGGN